MDSEQAEEKMALVSPPERAKVGSLLLGRGSVHQYATQHYIDRQWGPPGVSRGVLGYCMPCLDNIEVQEPMIEGHIGYKIDLKRYVEDIEQTIFMNRYKDTFGKKRCWRWMSSGTLAFLLLLTALLLSILKSKLAVDDVQKDLMLLAEGIAAVLAVVIRIMEVLVLYWRERELRHAVEVCAWSDGRITRGRPLSLFIWICVYITIEVLVCGVVVLGGLVLYLHQAVDWSILTTTVPLFLVSEFLSGVTQREMESWNSRIREEQLKTTLLESVDILEEAWFQIRDFDVQNRVFNFKESVVRTFQLDVLNLTYMGK